MSEIVHTPEQIIVRLRAENDRLSRGIAVAAWYLGGRHGDIDECDDACLRGNAHKAYDALRQVARGDDFDPTKANQP